MNRKERRKLQKKGLNPPKEPIINVKVSEFNKLRLTPENKAAMRHEINQQLLEMDKEFAIDMDTMVLWTLHTRLRFGKKRLRRFYLWMFTEHLKMRDRYEVDELYPERQKLKDIGVDVEAWYNELFDEKGNFRRPEELTS